MSQHNVGPSRPPPKPPMQPPNRVTRQSDTRRPTPEELRQSAKSKYPTPSHAKDLLVDAGYLPNEVPESPANLAYALFLLAHSASGKLLAEGARSVAILLENLQSSNVMDKLTPALDRLERTSKELGEAAAQIRTNTDRQYKTFEEERDEWQTTATLLQSAVDGAAKSLKGNCQLAPTPSDAPPTATLSYAAAVAGQLPSTHQATLARNQVRDRQVLIDNDPEAETNPLADLTETELVAKANEALRAMEEGSGGETEGYEARGARHLRNGGVVYEFNTSQAAKFIREEKDMFLSFFGATAVIKDRNISVLAEYVPISHSPDSFADSRRIERESGLETLAITQTRWVKPVERRSEGQRAAHLILKFSSAESANHAIRFGVIIASKRVNVRKMLKEPRRCLRCQVLDANHLAADCKDKECCGTCGGEHRTSTCSEKDPTRYSCKNCGDKSAGEKHASWDRMCPAFISACKKLQNNDAEGSYRFFPTNEPWTWEQRDGAGLCSDTQPDPSRQLPSQQTASQPRWNNWADEVEFTNFRHQRAPSCQSTNNPGQHNSGARSSGRGTGPNSQGAPSRAPSRQSTLRGFVSQRNNTGQSAQDRT